MIKKIHESSKQQRAIIDDNWGSSTAVHQKEENLVSSSSNLQFGEENNESCKTESQNITSAFDSALSLFKKYIVVEHEDTSQLDGNKTDVQSDYANQVDAYHNTLKVQQTYFSGVKPAKLQDSIRQDMERSGSISDHSYSGVSTSFSLGATTCEETSVLDSSMTDTSVLYNCDYDQQKTTIGEANYSKNPSEVDCVDNALHRPFRASSITSTMTEEDEKL